MWNLKPYGFREKRNMRYPHNTGKRFLRHNRKRTQYKLKVDKLDLMKIKSHQNTRFKK